MLHAHCAVRSVVRAIGGASLVSALVSQLALVPSPAHAQSCEFDMGFAALRSAMGTQSVGECVENAWYDEQGNAHQHTTVGVFVWRASDNWTGFTDGFRTWISGPTGLAVRSNAERFAWESDAGTMGTAVATTSVVPVPVIPPRPLIDVSFDWFSASVNGVSPHGHHAAYVKPGDEVTVRLNTFSTHDALFIVDIEIYDHQYGRDDERVRLWQTAEPYHFTGNTAVTLERRIAMPSLPKGRYRVHLGVFTPDWHHMMAWNDYVGFLEVT
jgi:hypothetical protein